MKKLLICSVIALSGCATSVPVTMSFPQAPEDLKVSCPNIKLLDPATTKLSTVVGVVSENYGQYQECQIKVNGWIQWYESQKKIYESVK
jgi:hypothetical protein